MEIETSYSPNLQSLFLNLCTDIYPISHNLVIQCASVIQNILANQIFAHLSPQIDLQPNMPANRIVVYSETIYSNNTTSSEQLYCGDYYHTLLEYLEAYIQSKITDKIPHNNITIKHQPIALPNQTKLLLKRQCDHSKHHSLQQDQQQFQNSFSNIYRSKRYSEYQAKQSRRCECCQIIERSRSRQLEILKTTRRNKSGYVEKRSNRGNLFQKEDSCRFKQSESTIKKFMQGSRISNKKTPTHSRKNNSIQFQPKTLVQSIIHQEGSNQRKRTPFQSKITIIPTYTSPSKQKQQNQQKNKKNTKVIFQNSTRTNFFGKQNLSNTRTPNKTTNPNNSMKIKLPSQNQQSHKKSISNTTNNNLQQTRKIFSLSKNNDQSETSPPFENQLKDIVNTIDPVTQNHFIKSNKTHRISLVKFQEKSVNKYTARQEATQVNLISTNLAKRNSQSSQYQNIRLSGPKRDVSNQDKKGSNKNNKQTQISTPQGNFVRISTSPVTQKIHDNYIIQLDQNQKYSGQRKVGRIYRSRNKANQNPSTCRESNTNINIGKVRQSSDQTEKPNQNLGKIQKNFNGPQIKKEQVQSEKYQLVRLDNKDRIIQKQLEKTIQSLQDEVKLKFSQNQIQNASQQILRQEREEVHTSENSEQQPQKICDKPQQKLIDTSQNNQQLKQEVKQFQKLEGNRISQQQTGVVQPNNQTKQDKDKILKSNSSRKSISKCELYSNKKIKEKSETQRRIHKKQDKRVSLKKIAQQNKTNQNQSIPKVGVEQPMNKKSQNILKCEQKQPQNISKSEEIKQKSIISQRTQTIDIQNHVKTILEAQTRQSLTTLLTNQIQTIVSNICQTIKPPQQNSTPILQQNPLKQQPNFNIKQNNQQQFQQPAEKTNGQIKLEQLILNENFDEEKDKEKKKEGCDEDLKLGIMRSNRDFVVGQKLDGQIVEQQNNRSHHSLINQTQRQQQIINSDHSLNKNQPQQQSQSQIQIPTPIPIISAPITEQIFQKQKITNTNQDKPITINIQQIELISILCEQQVARIVECFGDFTVGRDQGLSFIDSFCVNGDVVGQILGEVIQSTLIKVAEQDQRVQQKQSFVQQQNHKIKSQQNHPQNIQQTTHHQHSHSNQPKQHPNHHLNHSYQTTPEQQQQQSINQDLLLKQQQSIDNISLKQLQHTSDRKIYTGNKQQQQKQIQQVDDACNREQIIEDRLLLVEGKENREGQENSWGYCGLVQNQYISQINKISVLQQHQHLIQLIISRIPNDNIQKSSTHLMQNHQKFTSTIKQDQTDQQYKKAHQQDGKQQSQIRNKQEVGDKECEVFDKEVIQDYLEVLGDGVIGHFGNQDQCENKDMQSQPKITKQQTNQQLITKQQIVEENAHKKHQYSQQQSNEIGSQEYKNLNKGAIQEYLGCLENGVIDTNAVGDLVNVKQQQDDSVQKDVVGVRQNVKGQDLSVVSKNQQSVEKQQETQKQINLNNNKNNKQPQQIISQQTTKQDPTTTPNNQTQHQSQQSTSQHPNTSPNKNNISKQTQQIINKQIIKNQQLNEGELELDSNQNFKEINLQDYCGPVEEDLDDDCDSEIRRQTVKEYLRSQIEIFISNTQGQEVFSEKLIDVREGEDKLETKLQDQFVVVDEDTDIKHKQHINITVKHQQKQQSIHNDKIVENHQNEQHPNGKQLTGVHRCQQIQDNNSNTRCIQQKIENQHTNEDNFRLMNILVKIDQHTNQFKHENNNQIEPINNKFSSSHQIQKIPPDTDFSQQNKKLPSTLINKDQEDYQKLNQNKQDKSQYAKIQQTQYQRIQVTDTQELAQNNRISTPQNKSHIQNHNKSQTPNNNKHLQITTPLNQSNNHQHPPTQPQPQQQPTNNRTKQQIFQQPRNNQYLQQGQHTIQSIRLLSINSLQMQMQKLDDFDGGGCDLGREGDLERQVGVGEERGGGEDGLEQDKLGVDNGRVVKQYTGLVQTVQKYDEAKQNNQVNKNQTNQKTSTLNNPQQQSKQNSTISNQPLQTNNQTINQPQPEQTQNQNHLNINPTTTTTDQKREIKQTQVSSSLLSAPLVPVMEEKYTQFDYLLDDYGGSTDKNIGNVDDNEQEKEQEGFCQIKKDFGDHQLVEELDIKNRQGKRLLLKGNWNISPEFYTIEQQNKQNNQQRPVAKHAKHQKPENKQGNYNKKIQKREQEIKLEKSQDKKQDKRQIKQETKQQDKQKSQNKVNTQQPTPTLPNKDNNPSLSQMNQHPTERKSQPQTRKQPQHQQLPPILNSRIVSKYSFYNTQYITLPINMRSLRQTPLTHYNFDIAQALTLTKLLMSPQYIGQQLVNKKWDVVALFFGGEWRVVCLQDQKKQGKIEDMRKFMGEEDDDENLNIDKLMCYVVERLIQSRACSATCTIEYLQLLTGCIYRPIKKQRILKALQHYFPTQPQTKKKPKQPKYTPIILTKLHKNSFLFKATSLHQFTTPNQTQKCLAKCELLHEQTSPSHKTVNIEVELIETLYICDVAPQMQFHTLPLIAGGQANTFQFGLDEVGMFVDQAGYKFMLYQEYEENKYNLVKSAEKYFHYSPKKNINHNYLFIVQPLVDSQQTPTQSPNPKKQVTRKNEKLTIRCIGKKQENTDINIVQAILKLAFFGASKNDAGGYENTNCVYLPALRDEQENSKQKSKAKDQPKSSSKEKQLAESRNGRSRKNMKKDRGTSQLSKSRWQE